MIQSSEYILQGWHIVGFITSFFAGGFFILSLLMPYVKKAKEELNELIREEEENERAQNFIKTANEKN